jgi:hypothetical protein
VPADKPSAAVTMQGLIAEHQPLFLAACSVSEMVSLGILVSCIATKSAAETVRYSAAVFQQLPLAVSKAQCPCVTWNDELAASDSSLGHSMSRPIPFPLLPVAVLFLLGQVLGSSNRLVFAAGFSRDDVAELQDDRRNVGLSSDELYQRDSGLEVIAVVALA